MKIYLDDERKTPKGWIRTYGVKETIDLLKTNKVKEISLDHDLGKENENGYDVLLWIEEELYFKRLNPLKIHIHTANLSARKKMELAVKNIKRR